MLIDDEQSYRRTFSLSMMQSGYETLTCENGINALKKLEMYMKNNVLPAFVVIDIKLPDIDGVRLYKIIKFKYPQLPLILISAYSEYLQSDEVKELEAARILEKPFTADELTEQFKDIMEGIDLIQKPEVKEAIEKSVSSAYVMIKLNDDIDYYDTYRKLFFMENIVYCDATKGDYDILLLIQDTSEERCIEFYKNKIKTLSFIESSEYCLVATPLLDDATNEILNSAEAAFSNENKYFNKKGYSKNGVSSYVFIKADKEKIETLYPILQLNKNIINCDYTTGSYNIILFMQGNFFGEIDKIIEDQINNLDGILKVKEFPVISLMEM